MSVGLVLGIDPLELGLGFEGDNPVHTLDAHRPKLARSLKGFGKRGKERLGRQRDLESIAADLVADVKCVVVELDVRGDPGEVNGVQSVGHCNTPPLRETTEPEHVSLTQVNVTLRQYGNTPVSKIPSHRGTFQAVEFTQRVVCGGKLLPLFKLPARSSLSRGNGPADNSPKAGRAITSTAGV